MYWTRRVTTPPIHLRLGVHKMKRCLKESGNDPGGLQIQRNSRREQNFLKNPNSSSGPDSSRRRWSETRILPGENPRQQCRISTSTLERQTLRRTKAAGGLSFLSWAIGT